MNKALSWTLAGPGFDAREAAREAARRQGKSLGEWLHGVISDETADHADAGRNRAAEDRISTVTARLERMGSSRVGAERRADRRYERDTASHEGRRARREDDPAGDRPRSGSGAQPNRGADLRLENALDAMEQRGQRSGRRAEDALASLAEMLAASERRRENERAGVETLADKLSAIDARLSHQDGNPINGALARLEARLEQIARRSEAEASVRHNATASADAEPMRRLEEKLNAVLRAVAAGPTPAATSPIALAVAQGHADAPQVELPLRRRRLGEAIADIADRQRMLDKGSAAAKGATAIGTTAKGDSLSAYLEDFRREMTPPGVPGAGDRLDFEALRKDITAMAAQLSDLAPRRTVTAIESQISQLESRLAASPRDGGSAAVDGLRSDVQAIRRRVDSIAHGAIPAETTAHLQNQIDEMRSLVAGRFARPAAADLSSLETLVGELGRRIEAAQAPGAGTAAVDALQRQVGSLAARLESTEAGLGSLATIERSMRDLFAHLEETRGLAEHTAARAAQEAVRAAVAEKGLDRPAPSTDIAAALEAMQEDADQRTRATLDVVHETLGKVVDRLAAVENGLVETRSRRTVPTPPKDEERRSDRDDLSLGAAEPIFTPRVAGRARPVASVGVDERTIHDVGAGKADFIAVARRAAQAAQTDPSVVALRAPALEDAGAARAGLLARSRDYVASHKRPVLMALAAVLLVAATVALVQRLPFNTSGPQIAQTEVPARVADNRDAARALPETPAGGQLDAMTPKALPHGAPALAAQIPGSDPIATGSIPSLPAFAARAATSAPTPPAPTLPAGLVRMAEAGDGAAEYTLATAYAEGRAAPRDFPRAAQLYAKAADKGIVPAEYRLGALYEKGLGVTQNKVRARSLYQQAADAGNPRAMHNLAVLLADGDGKPDYEGAATWFRKAAQYGVHDSQFNLAILLARGLGVDQSLVQSYQWFAIAAQQGDSDAAGKRDEVGSKLSASELSVAKALAAAFHPRVPDAAATEVAPPPGGWDGDSAPLHLNSAKTKIS